MECGVDQVASLSYSSLYRCRYCGKYLLDLQDRGKLSDKPDDKFKIACVLNERRLKKLGGIALNDKTDMKDKVLGLPRISVDDILNAFPSKASDCLNRTLLNLSRLPTRPFEVIRFDMSEDYLHIFTPSRKAGQTFLQELAEQGFIRFNEVAGGLQWDVFSLTIKFWETVENLQKIEVGNKRAFVAMWFDGSMNAYYLYCLTLEINTTYFTIYSYGTTRSAIVLR
jgi:hypothetical protein